MGRPAGIRSATGPAVTPDNSVRPPSANPRSRAARFTAGPYQSPSRGSASPVRTPARTRNGSAVGHLSTPSDACMATAATTASAGWANTENVQSPSPLLRTSVPPRRNNLATDDRVMAGNRPRHRVGLAFPQRHRIDNVRQHERARYQPSVLVGTTTFSQGPQPPPTFDADPRQLEPGAARGSASWLRVRVAAADSAAAGQLHEARTIGRPDHGRIVRLRWRASVLARSATWDVSSLSSLYLFWSRWP